LKQEIASIEHAVQQLRYPLKYHFVLNPNGKAVAFPIAAGNIPNTKIAFPLIASTRTRPHNC
jgi:hypothetical protein